MTKNQSIAQRVKEIRQQIPSGIRLIAVTKQVSIEAMREAYAAGIRDFGENRLQEASLKQEQLKDLPDICWHFIGHLQANKAKKVLEQFQWIHSVDNLKIAERLNRLVPQLSCDPQVLLQVKVLPDPDKFGWEIPELLAALPQLEGCDRLNVRGLMTILPLGLSDSQTLEAFQTTTKLAQTLQQRSHLPIRELSMGMSDDYPYAVQAGATMIRLGRILFGERSANI